MSSKQHFHHIWEMMAAHDLMLACKCRSLQAVGDLPYAKGLSQGRLAWVANCDQHYPGGAVCRSRGRTAQHQ